MYTDPLRQNCRRPDVEHMSVMTKEHVYVGAIYVAACLIYKPNKDNV